MGSLLGGLAILFVGTVAAMIRNSRDFEFDDDVLDSMSLGTSGNSLGETVHRSPLSTQRLDGFRVVNGESVHETVVTDSNNREVRQVLFTAGYVELSRVEPGGRAFRKSNVPPDDPRAHARDWLMRGQLELYDGRIFIEIPDDWNPALVGWQLVNLALCLSEDEATWVDWLADDRPIARDHRHLTLLRFMGDHPRAAPVARRQLGAADAELAGWAALVADDADAQTDAVRRAPTPALRRALFDARVQHGVAGLGPTVRALFAHEDDLALIRRLVRATAAFEAPEAIELLRGALARLPPRAQLEVLPALARRAPAEAADAAFGLLGSMDVALRAESIRTIAAAMTPAAVTPRALPLLASDDLDLLEGACDLLAVAGTLDAVWPLRQLEKRIRRHPQSVHAASAADAIQGRQGREARGGLALSDATSGGLALSEGQAGGLAVDPDAC